MHTVCVVSCFLRESLAQRVNLTRSNGMKCPLKVKRKLRRDLKQPSNGKAATHGEQRLGSLQELLEEPQARADSGSQHADCHRPHPSPLLLSRPVQSCPIHRAWVGLCPVTGRPLHCDQRLSCEGQGCSKPTYSPYSPQITCFLQTTLTLLYHHPIRSWRKLPRSPYVVSTLPRWGQGFKY